VIRVAVITVSDRCHRGEREDEGGPAVAAAAAALPAEVVWTEVVPDDRGQIAGAILRSSGQADLVLTTGGTGLAPRDITPEATRDVIQREAPGFGEEMRRRSLEITPHASGSRAVAGTVGNSLVINLPGSPKGAVECLGFVAKAAVHAVELLGGEPTDCV
jgi:molybdenum cofactor synthesis domain-containing protein